MADQVGVTTVIDGEDIPAGKIYRTRATGSFRYDDSYLAHPKAFPLVPALPLAGGAQSMTPNPFSDSAPDTWGRKVMTRAAGGRTLDDITLLLGVNDFSRQGATRFWVDGQAVSDGDGVPVEAELREILAAADAIQRGDRDIAEVALRRLFRATGSLGGARPKAGVRRGSDLWLVKFPKPQGDDWNVMAWEASMLDAMSAAGIDVPDHETSTLTVGSEPRTVLFLKRFDRTVAHTRIPYFSALTALEARDGDGGDWLDLADFTRTNGGDTVELWRRGVFGHLVGNRDDHLRNHGFLRRGRDWQLSPAFDVNPTPLADGDAHELALFGNVAPDLAAWTAGDTLSLFGVKPVQVTEFLDATRAALEKAPQRASAHGADQNSIAVMESRIENALARL